MVLLWQGLEAGESDARRRDDATTAARCRALLALDEIDAAPWRAEVVDLLDDVGVGVVLPGERA